MDPRLLLARLLLPRLAAGALSPAWSRRVMGWVRHDPDLLAAYEALRSAERAVRTGDAPLSGAQRELLLALVLEDAAEASHAIEPVAAGARRLLGMPALSGGLAAACLTVFLVTAGSGEDDLAARSARMAEEPLGVKVSCVEADGARVLASATGGARQTGARLTCPDGAMLAFSTTNLAADARHVFVVGVGQGGALRWYAPFGRDARAQLVPAGQVDAVLPVLADTRGMPKDPTVSLFVLVSDRPFDGALVAEKLERSAARGILLDRVDRLPVAVPWQARIDMVRAP